MGGCNAVTAAVIRPTTSMQEAEGHRSLRITSLAGMTERTWSEWFWLPDSYTWREVREDIGDVYPDIKLFWKWASFFGAALFLFRNYLLIPLFLEPIGCRARIRRMPYKPPSQNELLEDLYKINRARPPRKNLIDAATKINWSERKVERWLRLKALSLQMTTMEKFCDQGWQAFFYTCFWITGWFVIVPQSYFWDSTKIMENVPFQHTASAVWWYCAVDCGYYITQTITLLSQDRRHDFYVMLCHHFISFSIYSFCVSMNLMRLVSLSAFIHEVADIPLVLAKMFDYSKKHNMSDMLAIVFAIVWVCTRLIAYPVMVMMPPLVTHPGLSLPSWPSMFCLKVFAFVLLFLHFSWTLDLIQSIRRKLTCNKICDARSSPEELSEEADEVASSKVTTFQERVQIVQCHTNLGIR